MSHSHSNYHRLHSSRCAACKCLRRKCAMDCILAPHFPPSNPQRFASVHRVFGAANITKMLEQVPVNLRGQAAESVVFEAAMRMNDPVYGSAGIISQLHQQISRQVQNEILKIQGNIAIQNPQQQQQQQQIGASSELVESDCRIQMHGINGSYDLEEESGQLFDFGSDLLNNHFITDFNC